MYFYQVSWEDVASREDVTFFSDKKLTEEEFNSLVDKATVNALEYAIAHYLDCEFRVRWDENVGMKMGDMRSRLITEIESLGLNLVNPERTFYWDYEEPVSISHSNPDLQTRLETAKKKAIEIGKIPLDVRLGRNPEH